MKTIMTAVKKSTLVVLAAVALVAAAAGVASAQARNPRDADSKAVVALEHIGAKVCRSNQTVGQQFCAAGAGRLYELCAFGTAVTVGKGAMAFDTVSSTQWLGGSPTFQTTYGISPIVYGTGATGVSSIADWSPKCWRPTAPVRFENGLGIKADEGSVSIIAVYRLDSGVNP